MATLKTLVLGGYGNFGARICRALAGDAATRHHIALLVAGRDASRAQALANTLGHGVQGVALDHQAPGLAATLREWGVDLVIHTAGPFQAQGYSVAQAAAEAGAHYIDLADGRRFVCDFPAAMQAAFTAAGRTAIAGASTVPALSSAVIDHLCADWQCIDSIDICIAPAQRAPRGQATLAAVLSYCGLVIDVWQDGRWQPKRGWAQPTPVQFQRLRPRLGAVCDIPDLEIFPAHYKARDRVTFRAARWTFWARHWAAWWCAWRAPVRKASPAAAPGTLQPTTTMAPRSPAWPPSCWPASSQPGNRCPAGRTPAPACCPWRPLHPSLRSGAW